MTEQAIIQTKSKQQEESLSNLEECEFKFKQIEENNPIINTNLHDFSCIGFLGQERNLESDKSTGIENRRRYGLLGSTMILFKDDDQFEIESVLDISFSTFKEIYTNSNNNNIKKKRFGFSLQKYYQQVIFTTERLQDIQTWKKHLGCYVILQNIRNYYSFQQVLGEGGCGEVYLARQIESNEENTQELRPQVAIKTINKLRVARNNQGITNLINEIKIHQTLQNCGNILQLYEIYEDNIDVHLVLEYQKYGSLLEPILEKQTFTEQQIKSIMEQLLLTIDFFHSKMIVHRDLKIENILINQIDGGSYDVRIADFGISSFLQEKELLFRKCGTPGYCAPELLNGRGYDYKADIFSLGVVFYNMVTKRYIFSGQNANEVLKQNAICSHEHIYQHLDNSCLSQIGKDLLLRMISADFRLRPTAREALEHSWFKGDSVIIKELLAVNKQLCTGLVRHNDALSSDRIESNQEVLKGVNCYENQQNINEKTDEYSQLLQQPTYHINISTTKSNQIKSHSSQSFQSINYYNELQKSKSRGSSFHQVQEFKTGQDSKPKSSFFKQQLRKISDINGEAVLGQFYLIRKNQSQMVQKQIYRKKSEDDEDRSFEELLIEDEPSISLINHTASQQSEDIINCDSIKALNESNIIRQEMLMSNKNRVVKQRLLM